MPLLNPVQRKLLRGGCERLGNDVNRMRKQIRDSAGDTTPVPQPLLYLEAEMKSLLEVTGGDQQDTQIKISDKFSGLARTILTVERKRLAEQLESYRENLASNELIQELENQLKPFDVLAAEQWFQKTTAKRLPRLGDFLTLRRIQQIQTQDTLPERQADEKFHVLQSSSSISADLRYYRGQCEMRDLSVALVFLDIDDFKRFNTEYGEPRVDRDILPVFMRTVEQCVFGHGHAYRYGGDEIVLIMPNAPEPVALATLSRLRGDLKALRYPGIDMETKVSMGLCVLSADCPLTNREALDRAGLAKKYAKLNGKDTIASYQGDLFRQEDLVILKDSSVRPA